MARKGKTAPKRRGRPPLPPGKGKRASFTTRITPRLKETLEGSAKANGRSLSEEIEHRLELSIRVDLRDLQNLEKNQKEIMHSITREIIEHFDKALAEVNEGYRQERAESRAEIDEKIRRIREGK